jgi:hypothetical protein
MLASLFTYVAATRSRGGAVGHRAAAYNDQAAATASLDIAELFVQALCDDSNYEQDWLWLAAQCRREHERRYCLQRALDINPDSWEAKCNLAKLPPTPAYIKHLTGQTG